jgi:ATP-dependent Clp protease ATP-binding subunit ClpC
MQNQSATDDFPTQLRPVRHLTAMAKAGVLQPLIPRPIVSARLTRMLAAGEHVVLVGPHGAGKTAVVELLAQELAEGGGPLGRQSRPIVQYTPAHFQLGAVYVNQFETRVHDVVHACRERHAILFLDRAEEAVHAGAAEGKEDRTVANLLLPFLTGTQMTIVAETTHEGLRFMIRRNPEFSQRFRRIDVPAMTPAETLALQANLGSELKRVYSVGLDRRALVEAIDQSERFLPDMALPGKAADILREAASLTPNGAQPSVPPQVTSEEVRDVLRRRFGLPDWLIDSEREIERCELIRSLSTEVYGQPNAVEAVVDAMLMYRAGLNERGRPIASLLLVGPSGVGKTQLARATARLLFGAEGNLLRYDMAEYATWDTLRAFTSASAAGEHSGLVTEILAQPFRVLLFDEIEKAHPHAQALLLSVLGEARLTDDRGHTANFANTLIFLTSNVGADLYDRRSIGFGCSDAFPRGTDRELQTRLRHAFLPEFLNRLSGVVPLAPLTRDTTELIAARELRSIASRAGLRRLRIVLEFHQDVVSLLAARGFDPGGGARRMTRTVEELVGHPLARRLSSGHVKVGDCVTVRVVGDRLAFDRRARDTGQVWLFDVPTERDLSHAAGHERPHAREFREVRQEV